MAHNHICAFCSKSFVTATKTSKFCSRECSKANLLSIHGRPDSICEYCSSKFKIQDRPHATFCNIDCFYASRRQRPNSVCPICNIEFKRKGTKSKYCSSECYHKSHAIGRAPNKRIQNTPAKWESIKKSILERDNYTCQKCQILCIGKGEACVHHVIDREHNCSIDLITLCRPCHTQVTVVEQALKLLKEQGKQVFRKFIYLLQGD